MMVRPLSVLLLGLAACSRLGAEGDGHSTGPTGVQGSCTTEQVYAGLEPHCAGCHSSDGQRKFFSSKADFETTIAYNGRFVVPGQPERSRLVALLEGTEQPSMPIGSTSYAGLVREGKAELTMETIRCWITNLTGEAKAPVEHPVMRRLDVEQLDRVYRSALGLTDADLSTDAYYPVQSPDATRDTEGLADRHQRFLSMGGPHWREFKRRDNELTPTFLQTVTQMSQAMCRLSIRKTDGPLFKFAKLSDKTAAQSDAIRQNIAYVFQRFVGEPPNPDSAQGLFDVFKHYEGKGNSNEAAWTAVCGAIARHPLVLLY